MADNTGNAGPNGPGRGFSTKAVHAGEDRLKPGFSITDPIFCAATYTFADTQAVIDFVEQKLPREEYARYGNPREKVVERKLAALEGAERAILFSTGMSAVILTLLTYMRPDGHIIFTSDCYRQTRDFAQNTLSKFGIAVSMVDPSAEAIEKAIRQAHPYQVPEILAVPILAGSADYLAWLDGEVKGSDEKE